MVAAISEIYGLRLKTAYFSLGIFQSLQEITMNQIFLRKELGNKHYKFRVANLLLKHLFSEGGCSSGCGNP